MPELPEVETVRRAIAPVLEGRRIVEVELRRPRMGRRNRLPSDVERRLTGRRVTRVGRRGKFLMIGLDDGSTWVIHLGMSGRIELVDPGTDEALHTHFVARTEEQAELRMVDPRTFGFVAVFTPDELAESTIVRLGPDALEELPSLAELGDRLRGRAAPVKALLLDQRLISGLGNIYADEVLFRAGVHPTRTGRSLTASETERIWEAIPLVLEEGLAYGGTSLADLAYLLPDGRAGENLSRLRVYGRAGEPCTACGTAIERLVIAQRSTFACPRCQPRELGG